MNTDNYKGLIRVHLWLNQFLSQLLTVSDSIEAATVRKRL